MSGKAVLIIVIGFTMIFLVMGYFWGGLRHDQWIIMYHIIKQLLLIILQ